MVDYTRLNELTKEIDEILWGDWDPIGIKDCAGAESEYSSYAKEICTMISAGKNRQQVMDYLLDVETRSMGMEVRPGTHRKTINARNSGVVEKIFGAALNYS